MITLSSQTVHYPELHRMASSTAVLSANARARLGSSVSHPQRALPKPVPKVSEGADDTCRWRSAVRTVAGILLAMSALQTASAFERRVPSYDSMQTFKGQAYFADENTWIYSTAFAKRFNMPMKWATDKLTGIEAAAFRIVPSGRLQCGLAGKKESCGRSSQCLMDVYVDESKHVLPWASSQTADWRSEYDSTAWLFDPATGAPGQNRPPPGIPDSGLWTLHPWVDRSLGRTVMYFQNSNTPDPKQWGSLIVHGYRRNLPGNLTMVTLAYRCMNRNKRPVTTFILAPKGDGKSWSDAVDSKRFHEFALPDEFETRIDERLAEKYKHDVPQHMNLLKGG